ncbi:MAG: efflux RND transporter permease subunit [Magnetococcales bacterium]|nr:efflux RND transporter permease subunit [Magnetococcales bacterium]
MFDHIIQISLRQRLFVLAVSLMLLVYGGWLVTRMPVDVFPDLNRPTVTIMTEAPGLAPEEVEALVTVRLENAVNGIPGVNRVRTTSGVGLSIVYVEFEWGGEIYRNRQMVAEKLATVAESLPRNVVPAMGPVSSIMGEIMLIGLSGRDTAISPMDLRSLADWTLRPQLMSIPGVAQVIPIGGEVKQYQVLVSPARLQAAGVGFEEVEKALDGFAKNTTGGFLDQRGQEFLIRNIGQTTDPDDLKRTVVAQRKDTVITLEQVADVRIGAGVKRGDAGIDGQAAVILAVQKQPGANTVTLTGQIESLLAELQHTLPSGVQADRILFKQADFIARAVANVTEALRDGSLLVMIVLFLFLMNLSTTLISLTAIPLSLMVTAIVFHAFGLSINTMTLGGLAVAIGELVDDAVVDVENIFRRLRENAALPQPRPVIDVVRSASSEVRNAIVYATLIVVLVFIPLFALGGIEGRLFTPLGVAYIVSILGSLLVSLTLTPVLCFHLLPRIKAMRHGDSWLVRRLKAGDRRLLAWSFAHPRPVIGLTLALVVMAAATVPWLGRAFLPAFNEGTVTVTLILPPGSALSESIRLGTLAELQLKGVPEVLSTGRRTGRAELDEHAEGVHFTEIDVDLKPSARRREAILADLRRALLVIPGAAINVGQPISHRLDHLLSGVRAEIAIKIFGDDLEMLRAKAEEVRQRIAAVPGLADLQIEKQVLIPQVRIRFDRGEALKYGLSLNQLSDTLQAALQGKVVSRILDSERSHDVVVRLAEEWRTESAEFGAILIDTPKGKIPLQLVAQVEETKGPNLINRDNMRRRIVVLANTQGRDVGAVVADVQQRLGTLTLPAGYHLSYEGQFRSQQEATRKIALLAMFSLAAIFLVLFSHFRSIALSLVIMANIPMAMVGSVAALWLSGQPLSVASLVGFITLTGIAARNGILKISHYLHLVGREGEPFGREMIVRGSLERLTPVLMTALVTALALVPLMLDADAAGKEILHPVAVVIFGGVVSSTLLDTLVTPVVVLLIGEKAMMHSLRAHDKEGAALGTNNSRKENKSDV